MIPFSEPCGLWKSVHGYQVSSWERSLTPVTSRANSLTFDPCRDNLKCVDQLRVKPRCDLDSDSGRDEEEIERSQIRLSKPRNSVLLDETGDDGVAGGLLRLAAPNLINNTHFVFW